MFKAHVVHLTQKNMINAVVFDVKHNGFVAPNTLKKLWEER